MSSQNMFSNKKAAQETTQRAIRAERSRAQKLLVEAQNKHDGREKSLVEQIKHEEEKWEKERCASHLIVDKR